METALQPSRRRFLGNGALWLAGTSIGLGQQSATPGTPLVRIGLVTDLHYADKEAKGTRHYRETLAKLEEAGEFFASRQPDFVVELGDLIDAADSALTARLSIGSIEGNVFSGWDIRDVALTAASGPIVRVRSVVVRYDIASLLWKRIDIRELRINAPEIMVTRGSTGTPLLVLPQLGIVLLSLAAIVWGWMSPLRDFEGTRLMMFFAALNCVLTLPTIAVAFSEMHKGRRATT